MVQVQSTWFPLIDRNPQKFVPNIFEAKESDFQKATQRIYRSKEFPSGVVLSLVPATAATSVFINECHSACKHCSQECCSEFLVIFSTSLKNSIIRITRGDSPCVPFVNKQRRSFPCPGRTFVRAAFWRCSNSVNAPIFRRSSTKPKR